MGAAGRNLFNGKTIRAEFDTDRDEWMFSAVDIVSVLTERPHGHARKHWGTIKFRLKNEENELTTNCSQLKMPAADGKLYKVDVLNKIGAAALADRLRFPRTEQFREWLESFTGGGRRYILKHKEVPVIEVELDTGGSILKVGKLFNGKHLPVGTFNGKNADLPVLRDWWNRRSIPASREGLREFLDAFNMSVPQELLDKSFGLSLSDQYWICPEDTELRWEGINFFHNTFSEDVGNLLFGKNGVGNAGGVILMSPDNTSDGILRKKWKIIDGRRCLIKSGSKPFGQEPANEVLASRICRRLGIPYINYEIMRTDGENYSVCDDFITGDTELVTGWQIRRSVRNENNTSEYDRYLGAAEPLGIPDVRSRTDMMIVLDFIIANTDRHYNNFGLIRNADTLEWLSVAPIYDSGTSMWCKSLHEEIEPLSDKTESKPFENRQIKQIKLVKDLSWLDLDELDGIEDEFAAILKGTTASSPSSEIRNMRLCSALRERIELLRTIIKRTSIGPKGRR